ncbi:type II toxin-antitoxin system RelE/ParE family toxin [Mesorhizobium sp. IMUNJ 23232]|uniref:type II toxin-antitoxin system RelE/ParE family toxin n=1 Tax=Mesorhizobium sp. IMUNJ 23232 TaxID=3376064 RepID=UPI0037A29ED8
MFEIARTAEFVAWVGDLADNRARNRILQRIDRARAGMLGDVKYFDGIGEMRIDYGPGYRLYYPSGMQSPRLQATGRTRKSRSDNSQEQQRCWTIGRSFGSPYPQSSRFQIDPVLEPLALQARVVQFFRHGSRLIVLLCGGDKSTQQRDIRRALTLAKEI